jgi:hypothetical protein
MVGKPERRHGSGVVTDIPRKASFRIVPAMEAVRETGLSPAELLELPGAEQLVRIAGGRRQTCLRLPVIDPDGSAVELMDRVVEYVRAHPDCGTTEIRLALDVGSSRLEAALVASVRGSRLRFTTRRGNVRRWHVPE